MIFYHREPSKQRAAIAATAAEELGAVVMGITQDVLSNHVYHVEYVIWISASPVQSANLKEHINREVERIHNWALSNEI